MTQDDDQQKRQLSSSLQHVHGHSPDGLFNADATLPECIAEFVPTTSIINDFPSQVYVGWNATSAQHIRLVHIEVCSASTIRLPGFKN
jgi:hypothetical protein